MGVWVCRYRGRWARLCRGQSNTPLLLHTKAPETEGTANSRRTACAVRAGCRSELAAPRGERDGEWKSCPAPGARDPCRASCVTNKLWSPWHVVFGEYTRVGFARPTRPPAARALVPGAVDICMSAVRGGSRHVGVWVCRYRGRWARLCRGQSNTPLLLHTKAPETEGTANSGLFFWPVACLLSCCVTL